MEAQVSNIFLSMWS